MWCCSFYFPFIPLVLSRIARTVKQCNGTDEKGKTNSTARYRNSQWRRLVRGATKRARRPDATSLLRQLSTIELILRIDEDKCAPFRGSLTHPSTGFAPAPVFMARSPHHARCRVVTPN